MTHREAKNKIDELTRELNRLNNLYYIENISEVTDFEFDQKLEELQCLEDKFPDLADENSPTKRIGGDITKNFETLVHEYPMLSLSNTYSKEEIIDWEKRVKKIIDGYLEYVCELKYDGVAIGIRYENGNFSKAVTRGDGTKGEDVSTNVKTIKTVPLKLKNNFPEKFEIRGEIIFPFEAFNKLNKQREENGEDLFANPRNTASGTLKQQDSSIVASRGLDCFLYGVYGKEINEAGHYETVLDARKWGFKIPNPEKNYIKKTNSINGIMEFIKYWDVERHNLPFAIDGVVVKVNNYVQQEELGYTAKSPRWAIAFKFETERAITTLENLTYQVGRTGAITPVANLTPVLLGGTIVKRASLYNEDQIKKLDLHEKDTVYVEKGGEIIPKITSVELSNRLPNAKNIEYITNCPECGTLLERLEGEAIHYCPNDLGCPPQITGRIIHFIGRKAMDVDGLGAETVELLFKEKLIKDSADLYQLTFEQLVNLERMGEKSANNLLEGLEKSKETPFERILFALGIRYVGETVAKKIAAALKNINNIISATYDDLINIDEVGEKIALSIQRHFAQHTNIEIVERLKAAGLTLEIEEKELKSNTLEDKLIVVSGVFQSFSREELKTIIEAHGGKNVSSISKKTSFIVAGDNMGPSKLKKAEDLGVPILSESDFKKIIEL